VAEWLVARGLISSEVPDEDLVDEYRLGNQEAVEALLHRYRDFARLKARSYFLVGADRDDIIQEGMIGLYKAIRDFSRDKQTSFRGFAEMCVTRQIITAIKTATRQKHGPLNSYVSFSKPVGADEEPDRVLMDVLRTPHAPDPAEMVISHEEMLSIKLAFTEILSEFEADVLHLYVDGKSYEEIAQILNQRIKSVDNALQRVKRKVDQHLRSRRASEDEEYSRHEADDVHVGARTPGRR
jgi:RNA polymerase sporulation-specific sigma factor